MKIYFWDFWIYKQKAKDENPDNIIFVSNNEVQGLVKWYIEQGIDFTLIDCN